MIAFEWNRHFATGLDKIDCQHRHLIDQVNRLGTLIIENNLRDEDIREIFSELIDYAKYHFKEEQEIMTSFKVDDRHVLEHKIIHQSFIGEIHYMVSDVGKYSDDEYHELFSYLLHWLAYHILGTDQEMARQITIIKSGKSPAEAYDIVTSKNFNITEPLLLALKGLFHQISQKNAKLRNLNKTLEKKVLERTKELSKLNSRLANLSYTDQLTGLKNRRFAIEELNKFWNMSIVNNSNLTCMMIDADDLKSINDNYGHDCGDIVIRTLAETLQSSINKPNIVCRLGGDEFLIICPNMDLKDGVILAEQLRKNVSELKVKTGDGYWLGRISIGLASKEEDTLDYEVLIKISDINVYEAKRSGKNCVKY